MLEGEISKALVALAKSLVGWVRGSLALVGTLACMFFGAVSGSGPATTSAIGSIVADAMKNEKYPKGYTSAVLASSGPLGTLIPPSILMVVYGVATSTSISKMLLAGIGPGILFGVVFMAYEAYLGKRYSYGKKIPFSWSALLTSLREGVWALLAPIIILGGIYGGIFTPTEAAGVAVFYSLFVGLFVMKTISWKDLPAVFYRSGVTTGVIMIVVGAVSAFGYTITRAGIPQHLSQLATSYVHTPLVFLLISQVILLISGMFLNGSAAILLLAPLLLPSVKLFGIDPVFFGGVMVANLAIGMYTPPVAVCSYISSRIVGVSFDETNRAMLPFLALSVLCIALMLVFPQIVLFFPSLIK
jgi:C4-dicarboxylate transporter DctM subunit